MTNSAGPEGSLVFAVDAVMRLLAGRDVYVYFNNDQNGAAPGDAARLAAAVARRGGHPARDVGPLNLAPSNLAGTLTGDQAA